jgi:acetoin:2,6-dichlorophenolindophenol oxidoreductase subunit beta
LMGGSVGDGSRTGEPAPRSTGVERLSYAQAIGRAIAEEMRRDDDVYFLSTSYPPGGLLDEFGPRRIRRTPISETAFTGAAIGSAVRGLRPIVWWRNATFSLVAFDQVVNHAAKLRYMFGGQVSVPVVLRATSGSGFQLAAQHSQSPHGIYAQVPGLKVVLPSCASDAYGLMRTAIRDDNPVIFLEPGRLERTTEFVDLEAPPIPLGEARIAREGDDGTVVAFGSMVPVALEAASELARDGIEVEVLDPRTVAPLDALAIHASVRRTGHLIVVDEAPATCSIVSEVAAIAAEDPETFGALRAPVRRLCGANAPTAFNRDLEALAIPSPATVFDAVKHVVARPGRAPS